MIPETDSSSRRRRSSPSAQDQRRAMNQRMRSRTVQIRKQRKEEMLWRRRASSQTTPAAATITTTSAQEIERSLSACLQEFLQQPDCPEKLVTLQQAMMMTLGSSSSSQSSAAFFQKWLETDSENAKCLVSLLTTRYVQESAAAGGGSTTTTTTSTTTNNNRAFALSILFDLSSVQGPRLAADEYYGMAPLKWSDILAQEPNLISVLLSLLSENMDDDSSLSETVVNILGNLVQDGSTRALQAVLPSWSTLVMALPRSAFLCACILRQDVTSYGMDFMSCLSPNHITALLLKQQQQQQQQQEATAISAAWILEGLSRREDAAVEALCRDSTLVETLLQMIQAAATTVSQTSFLVPALQAIGNMVTACDGRFVPLFLSQSILVNSMNQLLERGIVTVDACSLAGCLLCDAGIPGHSSTNIAAPNFCPRLVSILTCDQATVLCKGAALQAIYNAVSEPPGYSSSKFDNHHRDLQASLLALLEQYIWQTHDRDAVMQSLIDSLQNISDIETVSASLYIINKLLRSIPESRTLFESLSGVESLEEVCDRLPSDMLAWSTASRLLDDLFDKEDEGGEEEEDSTRVNVKGNQFVFGMTPSSQSPEPFDFAPAGAGRGRGRGRTVPAWMQNQS